MIYGAQQKNKLYLNYKIQKKRIKIFSFDKEKYNKVLYTRKKSSL